MVSWSDAVKALAIFAVAMAIVWFSSQRSDAEARAEIAKAEQAALSF